jgi:hypothetical protein
VERHRSPEFLAGRRKKPKSAKVPRVGQWCGGNLTKRNAECGRIEDGFIATKTCDGEQYVAALGMTACFLERDVFVADVGAGTPGEGVVRGTGVFKLVGASGAGRTGT